MKKKPGEDQREFLRRIGRKGGKKAAGAGGRATLETMTPAARIARAYFAGRQGGRKIVIDHAKVVELKRAGMTGKAIAAELAISEPSVWRILRGAGGEKR